MKNSKLLLGFIAGCGFMVLISAKNQVNTEQEISRYHITWLGNSTNGVVYDAVTGEFKIVPIKMVNQKSNLKDLLKGN